MLPANTSFSLDNFRAKAELVCRAEVDSNPSNVSALVNLGTLLKVKKEHSEAETMFRKALDVDPCSLPALINLGSLMQNVKKDFVEAESLYRRALAINPNDSRALIYLGSVLHFVKGQYSAAEGLYRKALEADPSSNAALMSLGDYLNKKSDADNCHMNGHGHSGGSFKEIHCGASRAPLSHDFTTSKASVRHRLLENLKARAESSCRNAVKANQEQVSSLINLGRVLKVKKEYDEAESILRRALQLDPRSVMGLLSLGDLLQVSKARVDEAETLYREAMALSPEDPQPLMRLGTLHFQKGQEAEALDLLSRAVDRDPGLLEQVQAQLQALSVLAPADEAGHGDVRMNGAREEWCGDGGSVGSRAVESPSLSSLHSTIEKDSKAPAASAAAGADSAHGEPDGDAQPAAAAPADEEAQSPSMQSMAGRRQSNKFFNVILSAGQAAAQKDKGGVPGFLRRFLAKKQKNWTMRASALVAKSKFSYFQTFVPRAAVISLMQGCSTSGGQGGGEKELESQEAELVVLLVDISGFTRLSDRFHGLGQEGIDALTTTINKMFTIILDHVESWGGDVIKFAGDAVIVIWEVPSAGPASATADTLAQAIECARTLERDHGEFLVNVPDVMKLAMADQLNRHFASQAGVAVTEHLVERKELENLEMRRTLREVSWLKCLTNHEVDLLVDSCHLVTFQEGDVVMEQGKSSNRLYIIHSGEVKILLDAAGAGVAASGPQGSATGPPGRMDSKGSLRQYGTEISVATEGQILGEISFLTGQPHTATVVAARNCSMVMITPQALQPILKCNSQLIGELTELMQQHLSSKPKSPAVTLRIHQSLACGRLWLAHMGGEHVVKPHDYGARREFLVIGNALLRAAEALDEAPVGTIVVSKVAWPFVADRYLAHQTAGGNWRVEGVLAPEPPARPAEGPREWFGEDAYPMWTQLKHYCHEGARDLQDVAQFAAEVRKMTVLFVRLHLDLEQPDHATVTKSHRALLAIQRASYSRHGTLRQFLQDDKGLLAICIMGMPPFSPHENDPTRGVLAAMDMREELAALGVPVGIGITTGTAYSGFVGSARRREMCAMGSMVNMSARLMCKAGQGILVDRYTFDAATLMVAFQQHDAIVVKGRDEPLEVFAPLRTRPPDAVRALVVDFVKKEFGVEEVAAEVEAYLQELQTMGFECSWMHIKGVCSNLREGHNVRRSADGLRLEAVTDLSGLEHGLTRHQALSRGNFDFLKPYPPSHVQMLAKVACLLSHSGYFSVSLVRHVYCSTFPNFADLFDESLSQLLQLDLIRPASVDTFASFFHMADPEPLWGWARGDLLYSVYAQILGFKTAARSHLSRDILACAAGRGPEDIPGPEDLTPAFREFLEEREAGGHRFHKVYGLPISGFVHTIVTSLLKTYQRTWHRHAAEFFEQSLDQRWTEAHLILAHHWVAAADYRQTEQAYVAHAVHHLQASAGLAMQQHAYVQAVAMLQRACNMLDLVPASEGAAERKMGLLFELAPHTLVVYGHGSVEAIAAYQGLSRLVPKGPALDDRAVLVMAGTCVNLYGKKLFHAGSKLANQMVAAAEDPRHAAVGWALLVPALYHTGDVEGVLQCLARLREAYLADRAAGRDPPMANGVYITVAALSLWPAALLRHGEPEAAAARAAEALEAAERTGHPPTLCYALTHLYRDYHLVRGDAQAGEALARRAGALADRHDFAQCQRLLASARRRLSLARAAAPGESPPLGLMHASFYDL